MVTPIYAALLAILLVVLMLRVVVLRRKHRVGIGDGEQRDLAKAIRAHGNAAETIPVAVLLLLLAELSGSGSGLLHGAGFALVVGRCLHAYGLSQRSGSSPGRLVGMVLTILVTLVLAIALLIRTMGG